MTSFKNRYHLIYLLSCMLLVAIVGVSSVGAETTTTEDRPATQINIVTYPIVDTNQTWCFSTNNIINCGEGFNGQDAQYEGLQPAYQDNGDGTITDLNTGLMWMQDPGEKTSYEAAMQTLTNYSFAGYSDWRLPTIKELFSLTLFDGLDVSIANSSQELPVPTQFIDDLFVFNYGDVNGGRVIDSQWLTSTLYNTDVMSGQECFFGFNFADGRIKCYPTRTRQNAGYYALFVRGDSGYGVNSFVDNGDDTITDQATGLTWMKNDTATSIGWADALAYCETLSLGGADDWRLPNIKELHSIVDYSQSPDVTNTAAIDPIFNTTPITNEAGQVDYSYYWSSTTLINYSGGTSGRAQTALYVSFGRGLGEMNGQIIDVHGAGAVRSDPKADGTPGEYTTQGPQGDLQRWLNAVRCVRGGVATPSSGDAPNTAPVTIQQAQQPQGGGNGQGQQGGGSPPQAAVDACAGLSAGSTCSFQTPNGTINGVCNQTSTDLACAPNR